MSRSMPGRNLAPIFEAAEQWRDRCLLEDHALFSEQDLWTRENLTALAEALALGGSEARNWVQRLDEDTAQLPPLQRALAAELLWVYYLFPNNVTPGTKRRNIDRLREDRPLANHPLGDDAVLAGIADPSARYNGWARTQLRFLLQAALAIKDMPLDARRDLLTHAEELAECLDRLTKPPIMRHVLCYLLLPDAFEPLSGPRKVAALRQHNITPRATRGYQLDHQMMEVRQSKGPDFDFNEDSDAEIPAQFWLIAVAKVDAARLKTIGENPLTLTYSGQGDLPNAEDILFLYDEQQNMVWARATAGDSEDGEAISLQITSLTDSAYFDRKLLRGLGISPKKKVLLTTRQGEQLEDAWHTYARPLVEDLHPRDIHAPVNVIYYGPPGTGKTRMFEALMADERYYDDIETREERRVQFWEELAEEKPNWRHGVALAVHDLTSRGELATMQSLCNHPLMRQMGQTYTNKTRYHVVSSNLHSHKETQERKFRIFRQSEKHKDWSLVPSWEERDPGLAEWMARLEVKPKRKRVTRYEVVSFHQSYSYEEFVEGFRPDEEGQLRVEAGIFRRLCARARNNQRKRFALFIDEINRANMTAVFGELITLLEPNKRCVWGPNDEVRGESALTVRLPYSGDTFGVPRNLDIYATMNTADHSLANLDLALRRRFTFVAVPPKPKVLQKHYPDGLSDESGSVMPHLILIGLNQRITYLLDEDHQLGHAWLLGLKTVADLAAVIRERIFPLLEEYFLDDRNALVKVLGPRIMLRDSLGPEVLLGPGHDGEPREIWRLAAHLDAATLQDLYPRA